LGSATPSTLTLLYSIDVFFPLLLMRSDTRRGGKAQPTSPLISGAYAEAPVSSARVIEISSHVAIVVESWRGTSHSILSLLFLELLLLLLDEFASDDTENFIYALAVLGTYLVATVPAKVLSPEATRSVALWRRHGATLKGGWYRTPASGLRVVWLSVLCGI